LKSKFLLILNVVLSVRLILPEKLCCILFSRFFVNSSTFKPLIKNTSSLEVRKSPCRNRPD